MNPEHEARKRQIEDILTRPTTAKQGEDLAKEYAILVDKLIDSLKNRPKKEAKEIATRMMHELGTRPPFI